MRTWQDVRALRASPPDREPAKEARRRTFGASLQQAEEFATAAERAGYATKPVLLFYALSQASRAICAAKLGPDWSPHGHGLTVPDRGGDVLSAVVKADGGNTALYQSTVRATGETALTGEVSILELWAANADLKDIPVPGNPPRAVAVLPATTLDPRGDPNEAMPTDAFYVLIYGLPEFESADVFRSLLEAYPTLSYAQPATFPTGLQRGVLSPEEERNGVAYRRVISPADMLPVARVEVDGRSRRDYLARFAEIAPGEVEGRTDLRIAPPAIGEPAQVHTPLSLWWPMLLGLSNLARYRPALWVAALDVDRSPLAVDLERVLDEAQADLPHYIVSAMHEN